MKVCKILLIIFFIFSVNANAGESLEERKKIENEIKIKKELLVKYSNIKKYTLKKNKIFYTNIEDTVKLLKITRKNILLYEEINKDIVNKLNDNILTISEICTILSNLDSLENQIIQNNITLYK